MKRGFRGRCPRCGEGKMFRAFLKVDNNCSVCGLDFTPHRADDLPAYLVIVIVGHIVVPMALWIETNYAPPVCAAACDLSAVTFVASLALLQPVKGAVVGLQWALRMHGFDENARARRVDDSARTVYALKRQQPERQEHKTGME